MSKWDTAPRAPLVREAASLYAGEFIVTARAVGNLRVPNALHRFQFLANKKDYTGILMPMRPSFLASLLSLAPWGRPSSSSIVGILAHALGSKGLLRLDSAFPGFPSDRIAP